MSATASAPFAYNLLELYRQHRDEVDILTDQTSLFILAFTNEMKSVDIDDLAGDLHFSLTALRAKLAPLLRGQMMLDSKGILTVTALGRRVLIELGFIPPIPPGPAEPPKKPEPPTQPPRPKLVRRDVPQMVAQVPSVATKPAATPGWLWGIIAFLGTAAVALIGFLIIGALVLPGIINPSRPTIPPEIATSIPTVRPIPPTLTPSVTPSAIPTATSTFTPTAARALTSFPTSIRTATLVPGAVSPYTPTPIAAPPPAPVAKEPSQTISCNGSSTSNVTLRWTPVEDQTGISGYEWQVESTQFSAGNGSVASGSATSTLTTTALDCSASYRWRVRAVNGAGIPGAYSAYLFFTIGSPAPP